MTRPLSNKAWLRNREKVPMVQAKLRDLKARLEIMERAAGQAAAFVNKYSKIDLVYKGCPLREGGWGVVTCANEDHTRRFAKYHQTGGDKKRWILYTGSDIYGCQGEVWHGCWFTKKVAQKAAYEWVAFGKLIPEVAEGPKK